MASIDFEMDRFFGDIYRLRKKIERYEEYIRNHEGYSNQKWVTKDGEEMLIKNMSDNHLDNIIAMLEKCNPNCGWCMVMKQEKRCREIKAELPALRAALESADEIIDIL